jgi:DNA repair ATPase RecN
LIEKFKIYECGEENNMNILMNVIDGKIVFGQNEFLYQEVLDDFDKADFIKILTFNISPKKDSYLLEKLKNACINGAEATLITNIPRRYKKYYGSKYEYEAKKNIDNYIYQLDPVQYHMKLRPYFTFLNHSKIIMTNNVVYIGSSNFSDESKKNYECGYISTNQDVIEKIRNCVFLSLEQKSIPYYKYNFAIALANLDDLISVCQDARQELFEATHYLYNDYDSNFEDVWYYDTSSSQLTVGFMENFVDLFSTYENALLAVRNVIDEFACEEDIPQEITELEEILGEYNVIYEDFYTGINELFDDLKEVGSYDVVEKSNQLLSDEYSMEAYDEELEHYIQLCMQETSETYENLIRDAKAKVEDALNKLDEMVSIFKKIKAKLEEYLQINPEINNTSI